MFPYRRNGKKRGKASPPPRKGMAHSGQGRRIPGSARELLGLLQPTTKALAQYLAGNANSSGQVSHARQVLAQAQWLVDERQVERMPPAEREEFLEQLARLKLTLADAADLEAEQDEADAYESEPAPAKPAVAPERLREMALALAAMSVPRPAPEPPAPVIEEEPPVVAETAPEPEPRPEILEATMPGPRGARLRLKRATAEA